MVTYLHELQHPKLLCLASPYDPRYQPTNFHWILRFNPSGAKPGLVYLSAVGATGVVSTSVYERILLRLQTEARSNRRRTMVWLELVRITDRKCIAM